MRIQIPGFACVIPTSDIDPTAVTGASGDVRSQLIAIAIAGIGISVVGSHHGSALPDMAGIEIFHRVVAPIASVVAAACIKPAPA